MQTYTLTLNPSAQPGQLHLELQAEVAVVSKIVQQFLSADPLPVSPPADREERRRRRREVRELRDKLKHHHGRQDSWFWSIRRRIERLETELQALSEQARTLK